MAMFRNKRGEAYGTPVTYDVILEAPDRFGRPGNCWRILALIAALAAILAFINAELHWQAAGNRDASGLISTGVGQSAYAMVLYARAIALAALSVAFSGLALFARKIEEGRLHIRQAGAAPEPPAPGTPSPIESRTTHTWF